METNSQDTAAPEVPSERREAVCAIAVNHPAARDALNAEAAEGVQP